MLIVDTALIHIHATDGKPIMYIQLSLNEKYITCLFIFIIELDNCFDTFYYNKDIFKLVFMHGFVLGRKALKSSQKRCLLGLHSQRLKFEKCVVLKNIRNFKVLNNFEK